MLFLFSKARNKQNKISRAKYTSIHTTGSKTFAEIRDEEVRLIGELVFFVFIYWFLYCFEQSVIELILLYE